MTKRFLLFAGKDYYPAGGGNDFQNSFNTLEEAMEGNDPHKYDIDACWANIFDLEKEDTVKYFSRGVWYDRFEDIY